MHKGSWWPSLWGSVYTYVLSRLSFSITLFEMLSALTTSSSLLTTCIKPHRSTSYMLALENPIYPINSLSATPSSCILPSLLPLLSIFPTLTSHRQNCSSLSEDHTSNSDHCSLALSSFDDNETLSHTPPITHITCSHSTQSVPSQIPPSSPLLLSPTSHTIHTHPTLTTASDVNYPTTAAEIIELLHKNICFLSGGRAKEGQSLITFPAKDKNFEYNRDELRRVIQYLASIPMWVTCTYEY